MNHLSINTLLQGGKYKIVRFINSGGFGCTYEAQHVMLQKRIAIKEFFVKDFCNRDETTGQVTVGTLCKQHLVGKMLTKFIEEARALCQLEHPGIVKVSDVFEENGTAYFVMKFIDGPSLSEIVKKEGQMSESRALKYILQVAEALQYVHEHNRLHLDIKPSNIMIGPNDQAVLIDFGASKQYDEEDGENTSTLLGKTPGYAPLEQMSNNVAKFLPATDVYALGATLYKTLTGNTPPSANLLATGEALPTLPLYINDNTRNAIYSAMKTNKNDRPQTVKEFIAILQGEVHKNESHQARRADFSKQEEETIHDTIKVDDTKKEIPLKNDKKKKGRKNNIVIISISAILLVGICIVAFLWSTPKQEVENKPVAVDSLALNAPSLPTTVDHIEFTNSKGVTFQYSGPVNAKGWPHGKGHGIYGNDNYIGTYDGYYVDGLREGEAIYETKKIGEENYCDHFSGTYEDDSYHEGKLTFEENFYYEGYFKNNNFDVGKLVLKDGSYFVGTFKDNECDAGKWYDKDNNLINK